MMKKHNEQTLAEAMQLMIREYRLGAQLSERRIQQLWPELMGKTIATYTSDITVRKNVLYLTILSAPLKHELSYSREKIRDLINQALAEEFLQEVVIR